MSDGFFYWYRTGCGQEEFAGFLKIFENHGITLTNPETGLITMITHGPDSWGEQVTVTWDVLISKTAPKAGSETNFQLWLDGDTDVFTRIRHLSDGRAVIEFGLDGLSVSQQENVINASMQGIRTDRQQCTGFIVDRRGVSEEVDWDAVVKDGSAPVEVWPDAVGLQPEIAQRYARPMGAYATRESALLVFHREHPVK